ncbi:MAG: biotin-independent malonate decarboxylase subunit gamma, partial [Bacteriovorax sp.]|nr:biotin-independent malonate decarboxylase subunit gamma [Rhizobacter sp.]
MNWQALAEHLFGADHGIHTDGDFLSGTALLDGESITVVGSTNHASIGIALALKQARVILDTMAQHPGRAILLLVDTQGQQLRRRDELLGIN